jgi:DNA-directed RNA polymerase subunit RPC12/RpoP
MSKSVRYHCLNCGENFTAEVLTESEKRDHREQERPYGPVQCPRCGRADLRRE